MAQLFWLADSDDDDACCIELDSGRMAVTVQAATHPVLTNLKCVQVRAFFYDAT